MKFKNYEDLEEYRLALSAWVAGDKKEPKPRFVMVDENLRGANLEGLDLAGAILVWADLTWADLRGADLTWANLTWATLTCAKFDRTTTLPDGTKWTPDTDMTRFTR